MRALAVMHGDPIEEGRPTRVAEALADSVHTFPEGRFVCCGPEEQLSEQSFRAAWERSCRILHGLQKLGVRAGDTLILQCGDFQDFIPALWASLLSGAVALPLLGSRFSRHHARTSSETISHLAKVLERPRIIISEKERRGSVLTSLTTTAIEDIEAGPPAHNFFENSPDAPALLILSAGTTGQPKLVSLSARAVLNRWWPRMPDREHATTFLSWAPLDHVMGLGIASPNLPTKVHLPTDFFIKSPLAWLDASERLQATHCTMTNFGMSLIERAVAASPDRKWNLTSILKIGVGAEPISPRVCRRFFDALQPFGLRPDAIILGYGLSECGPVVGGNHSFSLGDSSENDPFISLDSPTPGHSVRIVDSQGNLVAGGEVGSVQVKGPTMALGYLGDTGASSDLFTKDGWIRTGDLGFIQDGRLTITAREKETIIINAQKYACTEIETAALAIPGIEAAFAVPCSQKLGEFNGRRGANCALFFDAPSVASSRLGLLVRRLRGAITTQFGMAPAWFVPIANDAVPRTHTGKVQRLQLAAELEAGAFNDVLVSVDTVIRSSHTRARKRPRSETEKVIASIWTRLLDTEDFGVDDDFFDLGGDSLGATSMALELEAIFGRQVPPEAFYENTTIARLAFFFKHHALSEAHSNKLGNRHLLGDQLPAKQPALAPLETRIRACINVWRGGTIAPEGLLVGMNREGKKRPLFWCLQAITQLTQLALHLGPDQPVYGMRSGLLIMSYTKTNVSTLARRYVSEILSIEGTGPYLIGGNCQGAIIAVEVARQLQRAGREVQLLTVLETRFVDSFQDEIYPGKVVFFAGVKSRFNPYRQFRSPEMGWRKLIPEGLRFVLLPTDHEVYFSDQVMHMFASEFEAAVDWAKTNTTTDYPSAEGALPKSGYKAELKVPQKIGMDMGDSCIVKVDVKNLGSVTWGATERSGIRIGNHWLTPKGEIIIWADGRAPLAGPLAPGEKATVNLKVQAPSEPGHYLVEFDLVEEGVTWFGEKGGPTAFMEVTVSKRNLACR